MEEISISISSGVINILDVVVYYKDKICVINGKSFNVSDSFLSRLLNIISSFKNEYGCADGIDLEEFIIKVKYNGNISTYHGKGIYPMYYNSLKDLIGEVYE